MAAIFSGLRNSFPGNREEGCGDRFDSWLLVSETEDLVLTRPFGGQVEQACDAHAAGEPALDGSLYEIGREECERDRLFDLRELQRSVVAMLSVVTFGSALI